MEHEYKRVGALHLFAAFDTRSGKVYARTDTRKRQAECIAFLSLVDQQLPASITRIFLVLDNVKMPKGRQVQAWLAAPPRFIAFVEEWHAHAHPFNWSTKSVAKVMAKCGTPAVSIPAA